MNTALELIILHLCLAAWFGVILGHAVGRLGERSFRLRLKIFRWVLKEKFDNEDCYRAWLKGFYYGTIPAAILFYVIILILILI